MRTIVVLGTVLSLLASASAQTTSVRIAGVTQASPEALSGPSSSGRAACPLLSVCNSPEPFPGGVGCEGNYIWMGVFFGSSLLWQIDPVTCTVLKSIPAPDIHIGGVAWDGTAVWCCPEQTGQIYRLDPNTGAILHVIPAPSFGESDPNAAGVGWDGAALWHADYGHMTIYKLSPVDGAILHSFPYIGSGVPSGVSYEGGRVIVGCTANKVFQLDPTTGAILDECETGGSSTWGVGIDTVGAEWVASGNTNQLLHFGASSGGGYCFGDPGSGTPCPCNNDNDGSIPGSGCANGVFASGAHLTSSGTPSVSNDTLVLSTINLEPNNSGLYFQAENDLSPGIVWGDGLRCAGGNLKRLQVRFASAAGTSATTVGISAKAGNVNAGDTKYYQCWYRTIINPPCGLGVNDFNSSNGLAVVWLP